MAFTTRSNRQLDIASKTSDPSVGPGSYGNQPNFQVEHGAAPFSSTTERPGVSGANPSLATPGPGQYYTISKVSKANASSGPFVSKTERFKLNSKAIAEQAPGPGNYDVNQQWISQQSKGEQLQKHQPRVVWYRAPTAPSIPTQAQSYGYEETKAGELIRQKAPHEGFTGRGIDSVGPAFYNPQDSVSVLHQGRATDFGASRTDRTPMWNKAAAHQPTPGPGQYVEASDAAARKVTKPSSQFASAVKREPAERKTKEVQRLPGPGSYNMPTSMDKVQPPPPERQQFFGSTTKRSFEVMPQSSAAPFALKTPGPGSYDYHEGFAKGKKLQLYDKEQLPFDSTAVRFGENMPEDIGPGAYDPANRLNFVAQMGHRTHGRKGVFGSCANRFSEKVKSERTNNPGPGHYEPKSYKPPGQLRRGASSVFASQTTRFSKSAPTDHSDTPAPGAYNVAKPLGAANARGNRADVMVSRQPRFKGSWGGAGEAPGPGSYDPGTYKLPERKLIERQVFVSNEQRFRDGAAKKATPGPGYYDSEEPATSLIKRSYNVTIEGALA